MANPLGQMHKTDAEARKSMNAFYLVLDLWMSPGGGAVGPGRVREYLGNPQFFDIIGGSDGLKEEFANGIMMRLRSNLTNHLDFFEFLFGRESRGGAGVGAAGQGGEGSGEGVRWDVTGTGAAVMAGTGDEKAEAPKTSEDGGVASGGSDSEGGVPVGMKEEEKTSQKESDSEGGVPVGMKEEEKDSPRGVPVGMKEHSLSGEEM
ncbi:hypothetical protein MMC28_006154 [Mycoblastus sanguinarius]|nr:hypothetical protein [Mycoblastus sanguinarius]